MLTITVYGMPAPQGSKRYVGQSKAGRGILVESSKKVQPWREAVKFAALQALLEQGPGNGPIDCALNVVMRFSLPRPKSAPKSRHYPDRMPDLSKLVRSTEDALTDAGVWVDDARVVECFAAKTFVGDHGGLDRPGCCITVEAMP